jgi:hypothetical protein
MDFQWLKFTLWPRLLQWRTSNMERKKDAVVNMTTLFVRGVYAEVKFLGHSLGQES